MNEGHPEQVEFAGGKALSSKGPPLHLIPTIGLERLANRFALGIERKGAKSWNALSENQDILTDVDFLIERLGHIQHHCAKLRDKLVNGDRLDTDDDSAAIAWGGFYAISATQALMDSMNSVDGYDQVSAPLPETPNNPAPEKEWPLDPDTAPRWDAFVKGHNGKPEYGLVVWVPFFAVEDNRAVSGSLTPETCKYIYKRIEAGDNYPSAEFLLNTLSAVANRLNNQGVMP